MIVNDMNAVHVAFATLLLTALATRSALQNPRTMQRLRRQAALVSAWLRVQASMRPAVSASRVCVPLCAVSERLFVVALSVGRDGTRVVARFNAPWARWVPLPHRRGLHNLSLTTMLRPQEVAAVRPLHIESMQPVEQAVPGSPDHSTNALLISPYSGDGAASLEQTTLCTPTTGVARCNGRGHSVESHLSDADWAAVLASPPELENSRLSIASVTGRSRRRQRRQRSVLAPLAETAWLE